MRRTQQSYVKRSRCPHCGRSIVPPAGPASSKILLVGEAPGPEDVRRGIPFVGRVGDVLRTELLRAGLVLSETRMTNLWQHDEAPIKSKDPKKKPKEGECDLDWHIDQMVNEFKGKTHVLLMGSAVTQALLGDKYRDHTGVPIKLPAYKDIRFWVSPSPNIAFNNPIGELRLALERFAEDAKKSKK